MEGGTDAMTGLIGAFTSAFTTAASNISDALVAWVPVLLPVLLLLIVAGIGIRFIQKFLGRKAG